MQNHIIVFLIVLALCVFISLPALCYQRVQRKKRAMMSGPRVPYHPVRPRPLRTTNPTSQPVWSGRRNNNGFEERGGGGRQSGNVVLTPDEELPAYPAPAYTEVASPNYEERVAGMI